MADFQNAVKLAGRFKGLQDGKLAVQEDRRKVRLVAPGFQVTNAFLSLWIGKKVDVLIVDDVAVQLIRKGPFRIGLVTHPKTKDL